MGANCQCERQPGGKVVIMAAAKPPNLGSSCSQVTMADKDSKGMLNHRLLVACRDNDLEALQTTLKEGAYLETRRPFVMRPKPPTSVGSLMEAPGKKRKAPREGLTPLMYAVQNGSVAGTKMLIEARALVNARDEDGLRPLHLAAGSGVTEVCSLLLSNGADQQVLDDDGRRAIDYVPESCLKTKAERLEWEAILGPISTESTSTAIASAST